MASFVDRLGDRFYFLLNIILIFMQNKMHINMQMNKTIKWLERYSSVTSGCGDILPYERFPLFNFQVYCRK